MLPLRIHNFIGSQFIKKPLRHFPPLLSFFLAFVFLQAGYFFLLLELLDFCLMAEPAALALGLLALRANASDNWEGDRIRPGLPLGALRAVPDELKHT